MSSPMAINEFRVRLLIQARKRKEQGLFGIGPMPPVEYFGPQEKVYELDRLKAERELWENQ
ncbi:hypothetical protein LCGC14_2164230 [marine sediment metagenome]|uniref:Uncharacterized protein n=1 Tax=marine sediment metagenome TaxID=412755 RepID=A0A0F9GMY9_9ZZZZ